MKILILLFLVPLACFASNVFPEGEKTPFTLKMPSNDFDAYIFTVSSSGIVSEPSGVNIINGNCSVSANVFTCNFVSGKFNSTPWCFPLVYGTHASNASMNSKSSSSIVFRTYTTVDKALAAATEWLCVGLR